MRNLLWDFDGTLASRSGMWTGTLLSILERNLGIEIKREDIQPLLTVGFPWHSPEIPHKDLFRKMSWWEYYENHFCEIFKKLGTSDVESQSLSRQVKEEYLNTEQWSVFSDVKPVLSELSRNGYRHFIASNHVPELDDLVTALGIRNLFQEVFSSGNIGYEKPNKKFFEHIFKEAKLTADECVLIGDSYAADIAGALSVNMNPILVRAANSNWYRWHSANLEGVPEILKVMKTGT